MNETAFWHIIELSKGNPTLSFETQCVIMSDELMAHTPEEIITFEHILRQKMELANTWPLMAASFVVCSFISDEIFEDFKAWIVGQGKTNFEKIIKDPNHICQILTPNLAKNLQGEHMLYVAANAYLEKINADDEAAFYDLIPAVVSKEVKTKWPETKNDFRKLFPKLYDTFWNEKRIQERIQEAEGNT